MTVFVEGVKEGEGGGSWQTLSFMLSCCSACSLLCIETHACASLLPKLLSALTCRVWWWQKLYKSHRTAHQQAVVDSSVTSKAIIIRTWLPLGDHLRGRQRAGDAAHWSLPWLGLKDGRQSTDVGLDDDSPLGSGTTCIVHFVVSGRSGTKSVEGRLCHSFGARRTSTGQVQFVVWHSMELEPLEGFGESSA